MFPFVYGLLRLQCGVIIAVPAILELFKIVCCILYAHGPFRLVAAIHYYT